MIILPSWYQAAERFLEPSRGLMLLLVLAIVAITLWLAWRGSNVALAIWLTYLFMP